jgi:hypothetical protein
LTKATFDSLASLDGGLPEDRRQWLIVHDQVSVPVDFANGGVVLDLEP